MWATHLPNMGPECYRTSLIPSLSGCRFYVIFIDNYSQFALLCPLIRKFKVFQCLVKFKLL